MTDFQSAAYDPRLAPRSAREELVMPILVYVGLLLTIPTGGLSLLVSLIAAHVLKGGARTTEHVGRVWNRIDQATCGLISPRGTAVERFTERMTMRVSTFDTTPSARSLSRWNTSKAWMSRVTIRST